MKINKLSLVGMIGGFILAVSSWFRYFVLYPDLDKAIIYGCVGILIIAVSWLYDVIRNIENTLYSVEEFIQDKQYGEDHDY